MISTINKAKMNGKQMGKFYVVFGYNFGLIVIKILNLPVILF